jgi:uncharacterized protein YggU (UPF0235/DUF167 family)
VAAITLLVKVKPNARVASLDQSDDGTWQAKVKAAPVDGKANAELVALIAGHFKCRRAAVHIRVGASGRDKVVRIEA